MALEVGKEYCFLGDSPVIKPVTRVKLLHVWNFPASNKIFVTIKDLENTNIGRNGQEEEIISTVCCDSPTTTLRGYTHEYSKYFSPTLFATP